MMYAFGDAQQPLDESVQLMDQLVMDYITELVSDSLKTSGNKTRIRVDDVLFALRRDQKKLDRANELLLKFDELNKARKAFDTKPEDY
ncbi:hypothetical protein MP228_008347 [Amoeboaphelidium protococcarum]|nr:hypothetical protein MP228_012291 [Amoeboaphelidium protococcarum]KAI3645419.1 hypothetical protein MP228_008347 [Amoeboaphelidium protococcarum]